MEINDNNIKSISDSILNSSSIKSEYQRNNDILPRNVYKNDNLSVKAKEKEKAKKTTRVENLPSLLKSFAVMTVALATGVGVINPIANTVSAELLEFGAYETGVYFVVSFSEYAEGLKAALFNSFTDREIEITDSFAEGHFEDLASNMQYTFVIKQDNSVLIKKTITTKSIDDKYFYEDYDNGNQENIDDNLKEREHDLPISDEEESDQGELPVEYEVDDSGEEELEKEERPNIADDERDRPQEEDLTEDLIGDDEPGEDEESNEDDDEFSEDGEKPDEDDVVDEEDSGEGDEENVEDEETGDEEDEEINEEEIVDDEEYNENEDETDEYDDSSNDEELDEEDEKLYENESEPNLFMG